MSHVASILIVETQPSTAEMYSGLIENAGYNVLTASDIETAGQILNGIEVDLILLTYEPEAHAWVSRIHTDGKNEKVGVIFMTHIQRRQIPGGLSDAVWFMDKPLRPEAFLRAFQTTLEKIEAGD